MIKPKEFWIRDNKATYGETASPQYSAFDTRQRVEGELIHVIEYSVYNQAIYERDKAKAQGKAVVNLYRSNAYSTDCQGYFFSSRAEADRDADKSYSGRGRIACVEIEVEE